MATYTYKQSLFLIRKGLVSIAKKLPGTFARSTAKLITNHPIYLLLFMGIIMYQIAVIGSQRAERDSLSKQIIELQEKLDSLENKHITYQHY